MSNGNSSCTDVASVNTETRLAVQVEKETRPMMHLVQLLKEMELKSHTNNNDDDHDPQQQARSSTEGNRKNKAISSLIEEFTEEVQLMERRIVHPELTNGHNDDDDNSLLLQDITETLPKDWVALLDPDSGDVYYSNEVSC